MTPKEFLEKYPDAQRNTNCLEDFACRKCGNRDSFDIEVTTIVDMTDAGTGDRGDTEWSLDSFCRCRECGDEGKAIKFRIPGLDDLIAERNP